jgi:RNA polymerase sigma factor (sigma-70 family)
VLWITHPRFQEALQALPDLEQRVIRLRYGLAADDGTIEHRASEPVVYVGSGRFAGYTFHSGEEKEPKTLQEVADRLGATREEVRVIERRALDELGQALGFDPLTD